MTDLTGVADRSGSVNLAERPMTIVEELLHLPDGRRFGEAMAPFQRRDFGALFDPDSPPDRWVSRVRGGSKTDDTGTVAIVDLLLAPDGSTSFAVAVDQDQARLCAMPSSGGTATRPTSTAPWTSNATSS